LNTSVEGSFHIMCSWSSLRVCVNLTNLIIKILSIKWIKKLV